jgi:hypothetical protein
MAVMIVRTHEAEPGAARTRRGEDVNGNVMAVGSISLQHHLGGWIAFQSRRAPNLLNLVEQVHPSGHKAFNDAFIVGNDEVVAVTINVALRVLEAITAH